jgi:CBS domain-containing protein
MHVSFPLLLIGAAVYSTAELSSPNRGIALWFTLLLAVLVRELARSIAAAYVGLRLRALILLPIGGVMAFSSREGAAQPTRPDTRWVALSGPIANFALGLLLLGFCLAIEPSVSLIAQPLIGIQHILRSLIWMQFLLGAVSLIPTSALPLRQLLAPKQNPDQTISTQGNAALGSDKQASAKSSTTPPVIGIGTLVAIAMVLCGVLISQLYWLIALGASLLIYLQLKNMQSHVNLEGDSILVRDVMLTEYTLLSSSDTLRGALDRTVHSMQNIFPVVRGSRLVGCIGRQTIAEHLVTDGDSYLQGSMNRNLPIAAPDEKLRDALRRAATLGASEFVPVVENNALIGILTAQSLTRAVQQVKLTRPQPPVREKRS